jgi:recombination protein RecA
MPQLSKEEKLAIVGKIVDKNKAEAKKGKAKFDIIWGSELKEIQYIPTNILEFDQLCGSYKDDENGQPKWTGRGGLPVGRYTIWWGSKGCGKSTMAMREVGVAQEEGRVCGYFDSEHALEPAWAAKQGVNLNELVVWRGGNLEQNLGSMIEMLEAGALDCIVIDTIHAFAALADTQTTKGKVKTMEDEPRQAPHASKLSRFFRIATAKVAKAAVAVLIIGQARAKDEFEHLAGGHALHHYNSLNLHFIRIQDKKKVPTREVAKADGSGLEKKVIGFLMKVIVDKTRINHLDQQFILIPFIWGLGPDNFEMNVMAAVKMGVIQQAGSFYTLPTADGDIKLQGKPNLLDWMRAPENQAYYDWLMAQVTGNFVEPEEKAAEVEDAEEEQ